MHGNSCLELRSWGPFWKIHSPYVITCLATVGIFIYDPGAFHQLVLNFDFAFKSPGELCELRPAPCTSAAPQTNTADSLEVGLRQHSSSQLPKVIMKQ